MRRKKRPSIPVLAIHAVLVLIALAALLPFLHVLAKSLSRESAVMAGEVSLWPVGFTIETYRVILGSRDFQRSFVVSVFVTVVGTLLHLAVMSSAAYVLSREGLVGKRFFTFVFIFTMLFSGGIIPTYLVMVNLGLIDSVWALILPGLVSPFNLIVLRNFFLGIPKELEEVAKLDGSSNFTIFTRIMLPLSKPALATVAIFTAVGYYNSYFNALMYIESKRLEPMSLYLRRIVVEADSNLVNLNPELANLNPEAIRSATVIAAALPILMVYPFLQRHFVKGVTLGAIKG
ncbi:MAG: carbohydrate ABC transporter permease [Anaerolineae bacterium]